MPTSGDFGLCILTVNLARYFGGAEVRVLDMAEELGPQGCQVACLKNSPLALKLKEKKFTPLELPEDKASPRLARSLAQVVHKGGFEIIDAHNIQSRWWTVTSMAERKNRPALVATIHSSVSQEHRRKPKGLVYGVIERLILPRFDQVIAVSQFLHNELVRWGIPRKKVSLVPNGVRIEHSPNYQASHVKLELGLQPDQLVAGTVGRLEPAKGQVYLLEAIASLVPDWPQLRCVIIGEGRLHSELADFSMAHGLTNHVMLTGFRSDVRRLLEAFDVFVLPSLTEGIPFALLEACACARPVVASRVGGVPEIISDGHSGLLVKAGDAAGLAAAIGALLRDKPRAVQFGQRAKEEVAARYSIPGMIQGTIEAYQLAMQHKTEKQA